MGYQIIGNTKNLLCGYEARKGLEGPFVFANGQVVYYDPQEGAYYDPRSDFYLSSEDAAFLHNTLINQLKNQ